MLLSLHSHELTKSSSSRTGIVTVTVTPDSELRFAAMASLRKWCASPALSPCVQWGHTVTLPN